MTLSRVVVQGTTVGSIVSSVFLALVWTGLSGSPCALSCSCLMKKVQRFSAAWPDPARTPASTTLSGLSVGREAWWSESARDPCDGSLLPLLTEFVPNIRANQGAQWELYKKLGMHANNPRPLSGPFVRSSLLFDTTMQLDESDISTRADG